MEDISIITKALENSGLKIVIRAEISIEQDFEVKKQAKRMGIRKNHAISLAIDEWLAKQHQEA